MVLERQRATAIKHEIAPHLRNIHLLGMPDLARQCEADVIPHDTGRSYGRETSPSEAELFVTPPFGISKPDIRMTQVLGKTFEVVGTSKRDHRDSSLQSRDLLVELAQLREMLLAVKSTEITQQDQNCWASN